MSDEQIRQRIAYLVEHGGLYEDPLDEIRKNVRWTTIALVVVVAVNALALVLHLV